MIYVFGLLWNFRCTCIVTIYVLSLCNNIHVAMLIIYQWQSNCKNAFNIQMFVLAQTISDSNFEARFFAQTT